MSSDITTHTTEYHQWLGELKTRYRQAQLKAAVTVNTAMLQFYWELGADMVKNARQWYKFWLHIPIGQQAVAPIAKQPVSPTLSIPWGHNLAIMAKGKQHSWVGTIRVKLGGLGYEF